MGHTSFDPEWNKEGRISPKLQVVEVRMRNNAGGRSTVWLLVERQEKKEYYGDGGISNVSFHIVYRELLPKYHFDSPALGEFQGSYHRHGNVVSITSTSMLDGAVFLDPGWMRGSRFGTYLMNEVVRWAKQWPDATVKSVSLSEGQSEPENKDRRNKFYEQFGLIFDYDTNEKKSGKSRPMLAKDLMLSEKWKENITEHNLVDYFNNVLYELEKNDIELKQRIRTIEYHINDKKQIEAHPLRWAFRQVLYRYISPVVLISVAALIGASLWFRYSK